MARVGEAWGEVRRGGAAWGEGGGGGGGDGGESHGRGRPGIGSEDAGPDSSYYTQHFSTGFHSSMFILCFQHLM